MVLSSCITVTNINAKSMVNTPGENLKSQAVKTLSVNNQMEMSANVPGNRIDEKLKSLEASGAKFTEYNPFASLPRTNEKSLRGSALKKSLDETGAKLFKLNPVALATIQANADDNIILEMPATKMASGGSNKSSSPLKVKLFKTKIYADSAEFIERKGMEDKGRMLNPSSLDLGVHYQGQVIGEKNSIVAISFF